jgi:hypothetical protein
MNMYIYIYKERVFKGLSFLQINNLIINSLKEKANLSYLNDIYVIFVFFFFVNILEYIIIIHIYIYIYINFN